MIRFGKRCKIGHKFYVKKVLVWYKPIVTFGKEVDQKRCDIGQQNDLPKGEQLGKLLGLWKVEIIQSCTFFGGKLDTILTFHKDAK